MIGNGTEDGKSGPWYQVPVWDGSPLTWREFQRSMKWWLASLDLPSTARYNLAARWLLRQTGIVRQGGEEFDPKDLEFKPAVEAEDPTTGEVIEIEKPDYLHGLNKLLRALEDINGMTVLDKRGELRQQFYVELQRRPGERVSEFATRFRVAVADLQAEGVVLPASELDWFMKSKVGLDPLRKQLLETALNGKEEYNLIESEILRLFKELHLQDPLYRSKPGFGGDKQKLTIRRMFQAAPSSTSSSTGSTISRSPSMFSSASTFRKSSSSNASGPRRVLLAEVPEDETETAAEVEADDGNGGDEPTADEPTLESFLQAEVECLATELQEAEDHGADADLIAGVEADFEQAAEALVTMKEARNKLQELRKDRGFNKPATGASNSSSLKGANVPAARKASGRHPCFDCNQHGHWAGDRECPKPGAGLGRKSLPAAKAKVAPHQVRVTEALQADHVADGTIPTSTSSTPSTDPPKLVHEASMVNHMGMMTLQQAFDASMISRAQHECLASSRPVQALADEKLLVGALDSACNRTCCGQQWLDQYLEQLRKSAPHHVQCLISHMDEFEKFKFGNGGIAPSSKRWRIPICLASSRVALLWVSVVPIASLGCLLGRDFLDSLGTVLNFADRTVEFTYIQLGRLKLQQMSAGHFMLPLLPLEWPQFGTQRWRKCGLDHVVELQLSPKDWLSRRLVEGVNGHANTGHEHMLTESSMAAACAWHESFCTSSMTAPSAPEMTQFDQAFMVREREPQLCDGHPCQEARGDGKRRTCPLDTGTDPPVQGQHQPGIRSISLAKICSSTRRSGHLALAWFAFVVGAAPLFALFAISLSSSCYGEGLAAASRSYDSWERFELSTSSSRTSEWSLHSGEPGCNVSLQGSSWLASSIPGGWSHARSPTCSRTPWPIPEDQSCCNSRGPRANEPRAGRTRSTPSSPLTCGTSPWSSSVEGRPHQTCIALAPSGEPQGHGGPAPGEDQAFHRDAQECGPCQSCLSGSTQGKIIGDSSGIQPRIHRVFMVEAFDSGRRADGSVDCLESETATAGERPGRAIQSHDGAGHAGCSARSTSSSSLGSGRRHAGSRAFVLNDKIKPGVKQMITQAWAKHKKEQKLISCQQSDVHQILLTSWDQEMRDCMNETFSIEFTFPNILATEVFTDTEPIARSVRRRGLHAGDSLTLSTDWNFLLAADRQKALDLIRRRKPYVVVLAFPCGPWSPLQFLNPALDLAEKRDQGLTLIRFAIQVAELQVREGRHYVMENPRPSQAWKTDELESFMTQHHAMKVFIDMCYFGLKAANGLFHRKSTQLVTSMQAVISNMLDCQRPGDHTHAPVIGGSKVTAIAGHYTAAFADALVDSFLQQFDFESSFMWKDPLDLDFEVNSTEHVHEANAGETGESGGDEELDLKPDDGKITITPAIRQAVMRLHVNTGHRSNLRLARALLVAGAPQRSRHCGEEAFMFDMC